MLSKFIESLHVQFCTADFREILKPFSISSKTDKSNTMIMINRGHARLANEKEYAPEGSFFFFPAGKKISIEHGVDPQSKFKSYSEISQLNGQSFIKKVTSNDHLDQKNELITVVRFDVELFNIIPFFGSLDIPVFKIPANEELSFIMRHLAMEQESVKLGHNTITKNYMEELIVYICRYIESRPEFKTYVDKLEFLADRRLVDIVKYVGENLDKDLSNKTIANIAFISEDYVGQFFKSLIGKNLQDYVENQRLEKAMELLKTIPDNIQSIAHKVGFKDPAYFSRRFKMKYGVNANSVRHNKIQLA